jgi:hypothetical protein
MPRKRHSEERLIYALKQLEGGARDWKCAGSSGCSSLSRTSVMSRSLFWGVRSLPQECRPPPLSVLDVGGYAGLKLLWLAHACRAHLSVAGAQLPGSLTPHPKLSCLCGSDAERVSNMPVLWPKSALLRRLGQKPRAWSRLWRTSP